MKLFCGFTCSAAVLSLLGALAAPARDAASAQRAVLKVTLGASVTKSWNTVTHTTLNGCDVSIRSIGVRKTTLRSKRPTKVVVTSQRAPSLLRTDGGRVRNGGRERERRADDDVRAAVPAARRARRVRARAQARERRGVPVLPQQAERDLVPARTAPCGLGLVPSPVGHRAGDPCRGCTRPKVGSPRRSSPIPDSRVRRRSASADVESDLDGDEEGRVTERVRWSLTFAR